MIEIQDHKKISELEINPDEQLNNRIDELLKEFLAIENQRSFKLSQDKIDEAFGNN